MYRLYTAGKPAGQFGHAVQIFLCSYPIGTINFLNDLKFAEHDQLSGWLYQQIEKRTILINILYII